MHTVPIESVIITENWVAEDSEIITDTPFIAEAWIGQPTQSHLTRKSTSKLNRSCVWNLHRNCFPSWSFDSSARTIPIDSVIVTEYCVADDWEIINKSASIADAWICRRKDTCRLQNREGKLSRCWLRNLQRDSSTHTVPVGRCRLRNHQRQCFHNWRVDSSAHKVPIDSDIASDKWVAHGSEIITETAAPTDARFCLRTQSHLTWKSPPKMCYSLL